MGSGHRSLATCSSSSPPSWWVGTPGMPDPSGARTEQTLSAELALGAALSNTPSCPVWTTWPAQQRGWPTVTRVNAGGQRA